MNIRAKRDKIQNIGYGSVVYELDEFGYPMTDDPIIVLNTETKINDEDDFMFIASLNDGKVSTLDNNTIVELADATLVINQY